MGFEEKTVRKNYVYRGKIVNLRCDDAVLPNGELCKREVVEHPGGAAVFCVRNGKVALVRQFRYAYGEELFEIPAGKLNAGEDPMAAAARELEEETGIRAQLEPLLTLYPTPGYTDEKIYIFRAVTGEEGEQHLDPDEFLSVVYLPVGEVVEKIGRGEIRDGKTIAALFAYLNL